MRYFQFSTVLFGALCLSACAMTPPSLPDRASLHPSRMGNAPTGGVSLRVEDRPSTPTMTLREAVELALQNNPSLRAEYARAEALLLEVAQVSSLDDPMAMVQQQEAFSGPMEEREYMMTLSQTFPWFGKRRLRGTIARSEALESVQDYRARALDVRRETADAWHELEFAIKSRALLQQERELLASMESATMALYTSGQRDRASLLRIQTESAMIAGQVIESEASINMMKSELGRLTAMNLAGTEFVHSSPAVPPGGLTSMIAEAVNIAVANRPELAGLSEARRRAGIQERLAKREYFPDITVSAGYLAAGEQSGGAYGIESESRSDNWIGSVGFNIPIPNARRRAAVEQTRKSAEVARLGEAAERDRIVESIVATWAQISSIEEQRAVYSGSILPLAEDAYLATEAAYRSAQTSYAELIDAQRTLLAAKRELLRIERDFQLAVSGLERAVGVPLEVMMSESESQP